MTVRRVTVQDGSPVTDHPSNNDGMRDPAATLDDFVEFLHNSYAPLVNELVGHGLHAHIERVGSGAYTLTVSDREERVMVVVSDGGKPLPPHPADVTRWVISADTHVVVMPTGSPLSTVAAAVVNAHTKP